MLRNPETVCVEHQSHFMCRATQDQHKSLCHHKLRCKTVMHDSRKDKDIRSNPFNCLWNHHAANQKIGDSMQPIGENKGFEWELYDHECITNSKSL